MTYGVTRSPQAVEDLRQLEANVRAEVKDAMERHLRHQPAKTSKAGIKRLRSLAQPQFRLRVSNVRVFYDVEDQEVHVLAIVPKVDAEEWLRRVGM
jgi:mRNA-degrading endonuclease RelE of RelBE toxin-antitoxin system